MRPGVVATTVLAMAAAAATSCLLRDGDDDAPDDAGMRPCEYQGMTYPHGARFPAADGCNSCFCEDGGARCTLIACLDAGPPDAAPACGAVCCGASGPCPQ